MEVREGQRFSKWETISLTKSGSHRAWICKCDCGTIKVIIENVLRSGTSTKCRKCYLKGPRVPREFIHEIGHRFGKFVLIDRLKEERPSGNISIYTLKCDCGAIKMMSAGNIENYRNQMCRKCALEMRGHTPHGMSHTLTYSTWEGMKRRCNNPKAPKYKHYGGKGIRVCERWNKFVNFLEDMGERPEGMVIDRIDCNGNYEPGNCRWVTPQQNNDNRILINKTGPKPGTPRSPTYGLGRYTKKNKGV